MLTLTRQTAILDPPEGWTDAAISGDDPVTDAAQLATPEHQRMVRAYVAALSRDAGAVDDLAQEVFVRAIERIDRLHSQRDIGGFLRGIARHVVQEHFRARRRDGRYEELTAQAVAGEADPIAQRCHDRAMMALLARAIEALPLVSRRMLEMRYHDGLNAAQIAAALNISHAAVRVSLLRIRERLRRALE